MFKGVLGYLLWVQALAEVHWSLFLYVSKP